METMARKSLAPPPFLTALLEARSPSGHELEAQAVIDAHLQAVADRYEKDVFGNRIATLNPEGRPSLMLAGHMDELGLMITYIDKDGFLYFDTVGGHDLSMIAGRRVSILTRDGTVRGVTGKRAVHLLDPEERKKVPEKHNLWIDIGAGSRKAAAARVRVGDVAVYEQGFETIHGSLAVGRAFDNKVGAYVAGETLRRLATGKRSPSCRLVAVATAQEEVGCRGVTTAAFRVKPDFAIAIDVGHATDHPECDNRKFGAFKLGGGPILTRGVNINPWVFDRLAAVAEKEKIATQIEADPRPTGTDGRQIQISREGVATGVVSVPLRYMHTPSEIIDLADVEATVRLLTAFARSLQPQDSGVW